MTATPANRTRRTMRYSPLILLVLSLIAYVVPWSSSSINSLNLGAYDLAEWSNRLSTASLLLRLQLTLITLLFAIAYRPTHWMQRWLWVGIILILTVAQLPPLDFITRLDDSNQRQQFILATMTLLGCGIGPWLANRLAKILLVVPLAFTGIVTSIIGVQQAITLMQQFQSETTWNIGVPLLVIAYLLWGLWSFFWGKTNRITG